MGLLPLRRKGRDDAVNQKTKEDAVLANLGYEQELNRSFGLLGMIGFSFSIVTCWTALGGVLIVGITSGGPPVMIYSWIGVCAFTLAVAYSLAEMCSAYPVAGGQYSWVYILSPKSVRRGLSFVTGWFMITGIVAMGATNNFIAANFVLGMANLSNPTYEIKRWHTVLVTYAITVCAILVNIFGQTLLNKISKTILIWNLCSFVVVITTILACNKNKQPAEFVFVTFQNETGFNNAFGAIIGLLQSFFGMCCYDAPAHMTEEMRNASKEAPKAIVMSVYIGAVTGFAFLISAFFCIGDIQSTALTPTGVPLIQIFYDSTGSVGGACALASLITVIALVCANSLMAEGSRALYAFARDRGLPASAVFSRVHPTLQVPVEAILLCGFVQCALDSIYFGNYTGFSTVIAIATEGFYLSYTMPLFARILAWFGGVKTLPGPYSLGKYAIVLNVVGLVFLTFAAITFNFPSINPVDKDNMNYCSAAIGVIGLISAITWFTDGRKNFRGPEIGGDVMNVIEAEEKGVTLGVGSGSDSGSGNEKSRIV